MSNNKNTKQRRQNVGDDDGTRQVDEMSPWYLSSKYAFFWKHHMCAQNFMRRATTTSDRGMFEQALLERFGRGQLQKFAETYQMASQLAHAAALHTVSQLVESSSSSSILPAGVDAVRQEQDHKHSNANNNSKDEDDELEFEMSDDLIRFYEHSLKYKLQKSKFHCIQFQSAISLNNNKHIYVKKRKLGRESDAATTSTCRASKCACTRAT